MKIALLANSFRDGGRCLAGIELDEKNNPVFVNNRPRWIRPVCKTVHEEVPTELALDVSLLDIIEFEPIEFITSQHQKENVLIENKPFKKAGVFSREHLPALCDNNRQKLLFTNRGKAVKEDQLGAIDYSLSLISAENFHVIEKSYEDKATPQIRGGPGSRRGWKPTPSLSGSAPSARPCRGTASTPPPGSASHRDIDETTGNHPKLSAHEAW